MIFINGGSGKAKIIGGVVRSWFFCDLWFSNRDVRIDKGKRKEVSLYESTLHLLRLDAVWLKVSFN